jgi:hypothetical protein
MRFCSGSVLSKSPKTDEMGTLLYRGQDIPVFTVQPDWQRPATLRIIDRTIVKEALDTSEERIGTRPRPLYGLRYQTFFLSEQETGYVRRLLELPDNLPFAMPLWLDRLKITVAAAVGAAALTVTSSANSLWDTFDTYALVWTDFDSWEIVEVSSVAANTITLAEPLINEVDEGAYIVPLMVGWLNRSDKTNLTSDHAIFNVDFEGRFTTFTIQHPSVSLRASLSGINTTTGELSVSKSLEASIVGTSSAEGDSVEGELTISKLLSGSIGIGGTASVTGELDVEPAPDSGVIPDLRYTVSASGGGGTLDGCELLYDGVTNGFIVAVIVYNNTIGSITSVVWDSSIVNPDGVDEPMTLADSITVGNLTAALYYKAAPTLVGTRFSGWVVSTASASGTVSHVIGSSWKNIKQASPVTSVTKNSSATNPVAISIASGPNDMVFVHSITDSSGTAIFTGDSFTGDATAGVSGSIGGGFYNEFSANPFNASATVSPAPSTGIALIAMNVQNI